MSDTNWYGLIVSRLPATVSELRKAAAIGINEAHRLAAQDEFDRMLKKFVKIGALAVSRDSVVTVRQISPAKPKQRKIRVDARQTRF